MQIAGIGGFIFLVYIAGFLTTKVYISTLPPYEQSVLTIRHTVLSCLIWFLVIPFIYVCNLKCLNWKYVLWYVFVYFSCLCNWISKLLGCIFTCLIIKSFWGIAIGWISFTVFYWFFLLLIPKNDRQHMTSSFQSVLESIKMGMPPMYFIPKRIVNEYTR